MWVVIRKTSRSKTGRNADTASGMDGSTESFANVDPEVDRVEAIVEGVEKRGVSFSFISTLTPTLVTNPSLRVSRVGMF